MATIQISKTKSGGTLTKTPVTQKQSLDAVQKMLHGGLSCISYIRELFAEKAYDELRYDVTDLFHSYDDYVTGRPSASIKRRESLTKIKALRRGRSRRVDLFLDWLEKVAFPALQQGNLQSLHIYIHPDAKSRDKVLESYKFNFEYARQAGGTCALPRLGMPGSPSTLVNLHASSHALRELLLQTMELCNHLPELPAKRYLSMALFYVRETTIGDGPYGFIPNESTREIIFPQAAGWEVDEKSFTEVESGFHNSSVNISYLKPANYFHQDFTGSRRPKFPGTLVFAQKNGVDPQVRRSKPIEMNDTRDASDEVNRLDFNGDVVRQNLATRKHDDVYGSEAETIVERSSPDPKPIGSHIAPVSSDQQVAEDSVRNGNQSTQGSQQLHSHSGEVPDTQSSNALGMRNAFAKMMHPEELTQGDTQTQAVSPSPILRHGRELADNELASSIKVAKPALSQHVSKILDSKKSQIRRGMKRVGSHLHVLPGGEIQALQCLCGYEKGEGDMVECVYCETWQHLHCYGYHDAQDERFPETHVCYTCLLGDSGQQILDRLKSLALQRRAVYVASHRGLRTQKDLARIMRIQPNAARDLQKFLKEEGYITSTSCAQQRGRVASRRTTLVAVSSGPDYNKMLSELFDPLMHISHLYEVPGVQTFKHIGRPSQILPADAFNMPPPTTPASQLRRKKAAQSPASGLDLRKSVTPFETPSRSPTPDALPAKRKLSDIDEETIITPPTLKRSRTGPAKKGNSVRSVMMLNVDGLSSSPAMPDLR